MKRRVFIVLLLLLTLAACHSPQREARRMVRRAELLFDTDPDSTASLIDSVLRMPVYFNEGKRMDMALLQAEALFGCRDTSKNTSDLSPLMDDDFFEDKPFLTTSPELERAAAYYAKKKRLDKAAHAALYSGFVQQHYGDKTAAMQSFKDAERYGGLAKDSLSVAWAQCLMGQLLFYDGTVKDALVFWETGDHGLGKRYADRALVQNRKAVCYLVLGDNENAEICLQKSLMLSSNIHNDKMKRKALNNYAVLYRQLGKYDQAIECLRQTSKELHSDDTESFTYILNMGKTFMAAGAIDSTSVYYQNLERILPNAKVKDEAKVSAYGALSRFAESQGDISKALMWREKHEKVLFDVMNQRQEQSVYRIQRQYDYETIQNTLNRKIIHRHQIIIVISVLLLISAFIILVLQFRHKRLEAEKTKKEMQLEAERHAHKMHQAALAGRLKRSNEVLRQTTHQLEKAKSSQNVVPDKANPQSDLAAFKSCAVCRHILEMVEECNFKPKIDCVIYKEHALDKGQQKALVEAADRHLAKFTVRIRKQYPTLTDDDTKYCCLYLLGLNEADISALMQRAYTTVCERNRKIKRIIGAENELPAALRALI